MTRRSVAVIGVGKRVLEAVLPALCAAEDLFEVRGPFARSARELQAAGRSWQVAALESLDSLEGIDLVYLAVGKDAVPRVLAHLTALDGSSCDMLIDTPVVRFKHFRHVDRLRGFRNTWVPEDCAYLPWIAPLRSVMAAGALGRVEQLVLDRSGYAYHGLATAKAVLSAARVLGGRRVAVADGLRERRLKLSGGARAVVVEPRQYAVGHVRVVGSRASASDRVDAPAAELPMVVELADGLCRAIRVGDERVQLDEAEASLTAGDPEQATLTARQEAMKRVGLLRLLRDVHAGRGAYPLDDALDDMVIDYHLEKFGRYISSPITNPRSPLTRALLRTVSRLGG